MSRFRLAHERFRDLLLREAVLCTTFLATPSVLRHESDRSSKGATSGMDHPLPVEPGPGPAISAIPPNQSTSDPGRPTTWHSLKSHQSTSGCALMIPRPSEC